MALKKRINLLHVQDIDGRVEIFFSYLRKVTIVLGICTVIVFGILFYKKTTVEAEYNMYLTQKEQLLSKSTELETQARKLQYVSTKSRDLAKLLGSDPTFMNYFSMLQGVVPVGTATINTFSVNKDKVFNSQLTFLTNDAAYFFLSSIEAQQFSTVFKTLSVDSIAFAFVENNADPVVAISLSGIFK